MYKEILTKEQDKMLPLVAEFSKDFGLVGGTAIAFYLGHRRSIDFDLFSKKKFSNRSLLNKIIDLGGHDEIIVDRQNELTLMIKKIKFTFFYYPYDINYSQNFGYRIKMPDLLTLAAMKAFALGQRAKWKDYVDLYFIIKDHFSIGEISQKGKNIFDGFNEKLFRSQLSYFDNINYAEIVEYLPGFEVPDELIKQKLVDFSLM